MFLNSKLIAASALLFLQEVPSFAAVFSKVACAQGFGAVAKESENALLGEKSRAVQLLTERKNNTLYPQIPDVDQLSIATRKPVAGWDRKLPISFGAADPNIERARDLQVYDDFKILSDLYPKQPGKLRLGEAPGVLKPGPGAKLSIEAEKASLKRYIEANFEHAPELREVRGIAHAKWDLQTSDPKLKSAFKYTEDTWSKLLRETHPVEGGSLLPSPYPVVIPAGRFQESYYWDTYFANRGLIATGRLDVAQWQVENFLTSIKKFGFIPNGGRDYYLSRSQPPFISSMVREVFEASMAQAKTPAEKAHLQKWLRARAYPLLKADYEKFWMNPNTRFDPKTGLNHHWDDINLPRPERHGADNELDLGKTFRDTRSGAEAGTDFTSITQKEDSRAATPLLNSMLFKTEQDLAWAARELGLSTDVRNFSAAAARRKAAMDRYLWDPAKGRYEAWLLDHERRVGLLSADTVAPLFVGAASPEQAAKARLALQTLEKKGGIMASELTDSSHQWDGNNGWAPFQVMAVKGLKRYGFTLDAKRIASKWVNALAEVHAKTGAFYERIDVNQVAPPVVDTTKYPVQTGFAWTNGSFEDLLINDLGARLGPTH